MVLLIVTLRHRARNDQRRPRIINQYTVHFIHHRIMVFTLHHLVGRMHHVIAEIVKTEFIVRTVRDVSQVSLPAGFAVRLVLVDTIYRQPQPFEYRPIPLRVTTRQIIIYRDDMHPFPGQCIQVSRQRRHQRFTFTRRHFRDLSLVQHRTADQLHIIMHHIPGNRAARRHPGILINGLVAFYTDMLFFDAEAPVQVGRGSRDLRVLLETTGRLLDHRKRFR